jgi:TRAP-type uncharacterized transport system substrate-binding protein
MGSGSVLLRVFAASLCLAGAVCFALWYFIPSPPSTITMEAGIKGSSFEHFAIRYRERLARHHITLKLRFLDHPGAQNVELINDAKSGVMAGFMFAGQTDSTKSPDIMSLGRINVAPIWIFYQGAESLESLTQLKGKRVNLAVGVSDFLVQIVAAHGVTSADFVSLNLSGIPAYSKALRDGDLDVAILPPVDFEAPGIQSLLRDPSVRLMNVVQADALTRLFPSLSHLVLPRGVVDLGKNVPPSDVNLIGSTSAVVVRKDLHPELVYLLAQVLKEVHSGGGIFHRAGDLPSINDPEFPVAEEAIDYYKNGPSFLQRYLPFWMIHYAKRVAAVVVAAVAIVIPLVTYTPRFYAWLLNLRLARLYRRLRVVDARLRKELTAEQATALQIDLGNIDRAANILPMRHSDKFFSLLMHIRLTRTELASRLAALRG